MFVPSIPWNDFYLIADTSSIMTPALVIYPDAVDANIDATLRLLKGNADRWRPHVKTAKILAVIRRMTQRGIQRFKCATTLELITACEAGATDVLLAYPLTGANAKRLLHLAGEHPTTDLSVLIESSQQLQQWRGSRIGIFIDIDPGMNRTGIPQDDSAKILTLANEIDAAGLRFRGLHYYDGHLGNLEIAQRTAAAHRGYDRLLAIANELVRAGIHVEEIITSGTSSLPCAISYEGFRDPPFAWRVSPGTVVYCDATCLAQLPPEFNYRPAALVVTRVVSHPIENIITCDAGHKSVSADAGVPTCVVLGRSDLTPGSPSEEHLPMTSLSGRVPRIGELLYLVPRHVCPTVNNFDFALMVRNHRVESCERVSARGREMPLLSGDSQN